MVDKKLIIYKSLDLKKPPIPPRSRLYPIEPIGLETLYVESLTSYITRLAEAYSVSIGKLISVEITRLIEEGYVSDAKNSWLSFGIGGKDSKALNGRGATAANIVQALETLTLRSDLRFLTMLTWADELTPLGLLRATRAWCPICYEEWRAAGQVIYEPLIWALDIVKVCPRHHQSLQLQCPYCYKRFYVLTVQSRPGYCSKCRGWLGIEPQSEAFASEVLSEGELKRQPWVIDQVGQLIGIMPRLLVSLSREKLTRNIVVCINQVTEGNLSAFARLLGRHPRFIGKCFAGESCPQLSTILQICYLLEIPLLDFLTKELDITDYAWLAEPLQSPQKYDLRSPKSRKKFDVFKAEQILQKALKESPPPQLKEVAKRIGKVSNGNLYYHFPDLCRTISSQHKDYKKTESLAVIQSLLEEVLKSDELPPPYLAEVARRIGYSVSLLYRNYPELCRAISAQAAIYRKAHAVERIEKFCKQVRQAAFELHIKGINPHSGSVGKLLSKPGVLRHKEVAAALHEVRRELGYKK
jgi:hypothetical protein